MQTTLIPADLRQPAAIFVHEICDAAEVDRIAMPETKTKFTALAATIGKHNAAVKAMQATLKDISAGQVDPATATKLPAKLTTKRVELAAAAIELKEQRMAMRSLLRADFATYIAAKKAELESAMSSARPTAEKVYPGNRLKQAEALQSMCADEIRAARRELSVNYGGTVEHDNRNLGVARYALALAVLDAANIPPQLAGFPDRVDL